MPAKPRHTLSDQLTAGAQIHCFYCDQPKPATGAQRFRAHAVCASCALKLKTIPAKEEK